MVYNSLEVGPKLRSIRMDRGLTIDKVSEITGLSVITVIKMESGNRNMTMRSLYLLMDAYKVDANTILGVSGYDSDYSIDEKLSRMTAEQRKYFRTTFMFMLDSACEQEVFA